MRDAALAIGTTEVELRLLALDFAHLRARDATAEASLMTSIGAVGQQHPVLVVVREDGQRVVIDGYRRVRALRKLGRETVVVLVIGTSEADALAHCHRLATGRRRSALEEGWLVRELCEGIERTVGQVGIALGRSKSWVSRRFGFATALPKEVRRRARRHDGAAHLGARRRVPLACPRDRARRRALAGRRTLGPGVWSVPLPRPGPRRALPCWRGRKLATSPWSRPSSPRRCRASAPSKGTITRPRTGVGEPAASRARSRNRLLELDRARAARSSCLEAPDSCMVDD